MPTHLSMIEESDIQATPQSVLEDVFGYQEFRDGQQQVVDAALAGKDTLVIMPTGGGNLCVTKCLCWWHLEWA
ncbi:hypothetical protein VcTj87_06250 [Vibrio comitans]